MTHNRLLPKMRGRLGNGSHRRVALMWLTLLVALCCFTARAATPAGEGAAEAAFEFHRNLIFLEVRLNGRGPLTMMLDTGTDPSALDTTTAKELGLKLVPMGKDAVGGGTGKTELFEVEPLDVTAGELKAEKVEFAGGDLSAISKALGKPLHGVLGYSFLKDRIVVIDYPGRTVRFLAKVPEKNGAGEVVATLPFKYEHDSILVRDVTVNGRPVTTLFDTGFNGAFNVMPAAIDDLGLGEAFERAQPRKAVGFRGAATSREGTIDKVEIGGLQVSSPSVIFWEKGTGHDTTSWGFTIGNGFLKDYIVTIDYRASVITLARPAPISRAPPAADAGGRR